MTKHIHIINGDSSKWKVKVKVQDHTPVYGDDNELLFYEWKDTEVLDLSNPGYLLTRYLTSTRRVIIEEDGSL